MAAGIFKDGQVTNVAAGNTAFTVTFKYTGVSQVSGAGYTYTITWKLGSSTASESLTVDVGETHYVHHDFAYSALPNAASGAGTVTVSESYNGTARGTKTYSFSAAIPDTVKPAIGSLTVTPSYVANLSSTAQGWGLYIQNKTYAAVSMGSVSAGSGATISKYRITTSPDVGSANAVSMTSRLLKTSGTVTFTATVTDSRGRTATKTASITVYSYNPPAFSSLPSAYRCTSQGNRDDTEGTYAKVTAAWTSSGVNGRNSITVKKVTLNGTDYSLTTSGTAITIGAGNLRVDTTYRAVVTITDAVGDSATYAVTIPSASYLIHVRKGGKSMGLGRAAGGSDDNTIHVGWQTDFDQGFSVAGQRQIVGMGYSIYDYVTRLGLTQGQATILAAFNALPAFSMLFAPASDFLSTEVPATFGTVVIGKSTGPARSFVKFLGEGTGNAAHDYRMYMAMSTVGGETVYAPDGAWVRVWDQAASLADMGALPAANVANNLTTAAAGYALDARQGKALYDLLVGRITNASQGSYSTRSDAAEAVWADMADGTVRVGRFICSTAYVYIAMRNSANYATLVCWSYGVGLIQIDKVGGTLQNEKVYQYLGVINT